MRRIMLVGLFTLGALTMSDTVVAQEPKKSEGPKEFKFEGTVFNERVTVKQWVPAQKQFLTPKENVWATRRDTKKGLLIQVLGTTKPGADLAKSPGVFRVEARPESIITDAAGNEYTVTEAEGDSHLWVKLTKAAPEPVQKKP